MKITKPRSYCMTYSDIIIWFALIVACIYSITWISQLVSFRHWSFMNFNEYRYLMSQVNFFSRKKTLLSYKRRIRKTHFICALFQWKCYIHVYRFKIVRYRGLGLCFLHVAHPIHEQQAFQIRVNIDPAVVQFTGLSYLCFKHNCWWLVVISSWAYSLWLIKNLKIHVAFMTRDVLNELFVLSQS